MREFNTSKIIAAPRRALIDPTEVGEAQRHGVLVDDPERIRPRYFDGRFLNARDLDLDQRYLAQRQRDLDHLGAPGVVAGLEVARPDTESEGGGEPDPTRLTIARGHGITRSGELLVLLRDTTIDLTDLPAFQRLDATFDLDGAPRPPARTQSGMFVLALRPVEFSSNPVAPYPRNIVGARTLEDGDIVEGALVTLWPLPHTSGGDTSWAAQADLARRVFVDELTLERSPHGLPLAIVAIARGQVVWVDRHLARRELISDPARGFGAGPRARLEAFSRHYEAALARVIQARDAAALPQRFAARDYFEVLPPAGPLPPEALQLDADRLTQWFLPPTIDVQIRVIPDDELPGLLEHSLELGAIDLSLDAAVLESLPVLIVVPVAREQFADRVRALGGLPSRDASPRLARSLARRRPVDALSGHRILTLPLADEPAPILDAWRDTIESADTLYFVRQRRRAQAPFALARYGPLPPEQRPSATISEMVRQRLAGAGELARFDLLLATAPNDALETLELTLSRPLFDEPLFVNGLVAELSYRARRRLFAPGAGAGDGGVYVSVANVPAGAPAALRLRPLSTQEISQIAARYQPDSLAQVLPGLRAIHPEFDDSSLRIVLAQTLRIPEFARRATELEGDPVGFESFATLTLELALARDVNGIRDLIGRIRPEAPPLTPPPGSTGFGVADVLGESALYVACWRLADADVRAQLDAMLAEPGNQQPLVASLLLFALFQKAWGGVDIESGDDYQIVREALYAWPFTPEAPLLIPTLGAPPQEIVYSQVDDIMSNMQTAIGLHGEEPRYAGASARFLAAGFPSPDLDPVESVRILAMAGVGIVLLKYILEVEDDPAFSLEDVAAELSQAVRQRDLSDINRIMDELEAAP